ncbi:MAG: NUDIX domain-containing protein [Rhizobacter sp.]|nr:NUDIX domain-containing protein [Bacteriovorax sp.]
MSTEINKKKVQIVVVAEHSVLLLEFSNTRPNNYVGFQNITGEVEGIETFEAAALREVVEEIGFDAPFVIDLKKEFHFHDRWKRHCHEKVFLCHLSKKPDILLSEEHLNFKWISLKNVKISDYTFPTNFDAFLVAKDYVEKHFGEKE